MINSMQMVLIKKDLRAVTSNKRLFSVLWIVPLVFTVVFPTILVLATTLAPMESNDFQKLVDLLPSIMQAGDLRMALLKVIFNSILPVFFLIIPIMAASVMAASSFVGEKEKRTLETLLYCPLTLRQIFSAKILASFILSMLVSLTSFIVMIAVVEIELRIILGSLILPEISWLILMLLVSPAVSLIAITLIVRGSAKAQSMEESQQRSVFLILPIILLAVGQFTGILLVNAWILLGLGISLAIIAYLAVKSSFGKFDYETLLR